MTWHYCWYYVPETMTVPLIKQCTMCKDVKIVFIFGRMLKLLEEPFCFYARFILKGLQRYTVWSREPTFEFASLDCKQNQSKADYFLGGIRGSLYDWLQTILFINQMVWPCNISTSTRAGRKCFLTWPVEHWCIGYVHYICHGTLCKPK